MLVFNAMSNSLVDQYYSEITSLPETRLENYCESCASSGRHLTSSQEIKCTFCS